MSRVESWLARLLCPENSVTMWFSASCGKWFCWFFIVQQLAATLRWPYCVAVSMIFWLCQGKYREDQCIMKLRVKWRHKVTVQLENQELWLEQHGHCMKPALREPLFIYPLPARRHNVNTKHAKHHQTLSLKQASSSMCHHHTVFTETEPVFLVIINNSSFHLGISS